MKVAIEARALAAPGGGVKLYTQQLLQALVAGFPATSFTAIQGRTTPPLTTVPTVTLPLRHELLLSYWLNNPVRRHVQAGSYDVVHFTKAAVPRRKVKPTVVTIYDVIPLLYPEGQTWLRRHYWPAALEQAVRQSDHVMTISETSRRDIIAHLNVAPEKITATPLAAAAWFMPVTDQSYLAEVKQRYNLPGPYILFVGTIEPRKNVTGLIRAFEAIAQTVPHRLVIAGRPALGSDQVISQAKRSAVHDRIIFLPNVASEDLPALYTAADIFVWPSIYEGWGLPPLEALACGTRVVVSNGGSLPEVVGSLGRIVPFTTPVLADRIHDQSFERALAHAMTQELEQAVDAQARARRVAHARSFSWQAVAEKTHAVYQQVRNS